MLWSICKNWFFPLWLAGVVIVFNRNVIAEDTLSGLLQGALAFSFVYGIFLFCKTNIYIRTFFSLFLAIEFFIQFAYNGSININILMSIINSSPAEASEFIGFHAGYVVFACIAFCVLCFAPINLMENKKWYFLGAGLLYLFCPVVPVIGTVFTTDNYAQQMRAARARGLPQTYAKVEIVVENIATRFTPAHLIKSGIDLYLILKATTNTASTWAGVRASDSSPDLLILGIGESLRADNLSLYGYSRNTTPKLVAKLARDEISIIPKVYSAGPTTWTALPATLAIDATHGDFSKSIINLAKDAGYKTYWLSNQGRYGATDRSVAAIAAQANVKFFNKSQGADAGFDSVLIDQLNSILEQDSGIKKKLIVLHFYGSHMQFSQRYPKEYSMFKNGRAIVDEYDNSVLYSDSILDVLLNIAKEKKGHVLFFADHGLRNPEGENPLTHDNTDSLSLDSLKVPLFYSLPTYIKQKQIFSLYYFPCLFSEWSGITAQELEKNKFCTTADSVKSIKYIDVKLALQELKL